MKNKFVILIVMILIMGCSNTQSYPVNEPIISTEIQDSNMPVVETASPVEITVPNCVGDQINPIGQSIANEYESADYEQVMTWFCNGAEFEDILVALETEALTDTTADEMLKMLADGFTWDDIWHLVGLTE